MFKTSLFSLILMFVTFYSYGQVSVKDSSIAMVIVSPSGGTHLPGGNLKDRFGMNAFIGLGVELKTKKQFSFELQGSFLFGNNVRENNMFDALKTEEGFVLDVYGSISTILIQERGFTSSFNFGYLVPFKKPNPNSGLIFKVGIGFMRHKIRIEHTNNSIPLLEGEYLKGYDRLTNGIMLTEFIGYRFLSNKRLLNFFAGFEFMQGFTKNRRDYNYDIMGPDNTKRLDLLNGIRVGWILPIYKQAPSEYYYY